MPFASEVWTYDFQELWRCAFEGERGQREERMGREERKGREEREREKGLVPPGRLIAISLSQQPYQSSHFHATAIHIPTDGAMTRY